jgi:ABC-2 type transport system permease protein
MSGFEEIVEVAKRDFLQRARSRAFLATTVLTVGLILVMAPLLGRSLVEPETEMVGIVGDLPTPLVEAVKAQATSIDLEVDFERYDRLDAGEAALRSGDVAVLLVGGEEGVMWLDGPDPRLQTILTAAQQSVARRAATLDLGLTREEAQRLVDPPVWEVQTLEPPDPEAMPRMVVAQIGGFLLYMGIIIFGQFILMGVMEEKQNRVVEVILSRIPPTRLLAGKILGIGLLGLLQILILGGTIYAASWNLELPDIDLSSVGLGVFAQVVLWYLLGFGLYAVLFGALGATVSRQEDAQGAVLLPTLVLVAAYFIAVFSAENPDGAAAIAGSLFPLTAPVVMPFRAAAIEIPWWQMLVSIGLVLATTVGMVRLGARVYSGAVLSLGKRVRLRDAWRASSIPS